MGIKRLYNVKAENPKNEFREYCQEFISLGSSKGDGFSVHLKTFNPLSTTKGSQEAVHVVKLSELGDSIVVAPGKVVKSADDLEKILSNFRVDAKKPRTTVHIRGSSFEMGDFTVRIGRVIIGEVIQKELLIEIEYRPCVDYTAGQGALTEFANSLLPKSRRSVDSPNFSGYQISQLESFGERHLSLLYA
eukprot:929048_1